MQTQEFPNSCLVLDTETSSLDMNTAVILQLAMLEVRDGKVVDEFSKIMYYGQPLDIQAGAIMCHGLTNDRLKREGEPAGQAMLAGHAFAQRCLKDGLPWVGVNIPGLDYKLWLGACRYFGLEIPDAEHLGLVDPGLIFKAKQLGICRKEGEHDFPLYTRIANVIRRGVKWNLNLMVESLGLTKRSTDKHDALEDVRLTLEVMQAMASKPEYRQVIKGA